MGSTSGYILDIFSAILSGTVAALGSQLQPLALVKEFSSQGAFKEFSVQGILGSRNLQARKLQSLNFRSQQFSGQGINFQAIFVWELSKRNFQSKNFRVTVFLYGLQQNPATCNFEPMLSQWRLICHAGTAFKCKFHDFKKWNSIGTQQLKYTTLY